MPLDDRDRVLEASDIADVVGSECALKAKGREYVCLCPFHDDRNPSMYVVPHKQMFHCFVCGAGGNAIDFVMRYHGMGFREALEHLAQRAGIELTPFKPSRREHAGGAHGAGSSSDAGFSRDDLARANAFALEFYRRILEHPEHGVAARETVERRGISPEMVEAFAIGAAPERFDGLVQTIAKRGVDPAPFEAAGLIKRSERSGNRYDALRNRLIFPIIDQAGRAIGFGGRIIDPEDNPKYLNSPETPLFQKGSTLYGIKQAWAGIRREKAVVVTEGYTDVIACHQAGFDNVVATLGTALTARHANLLKRVVERVVLLFDGDEAGQRAADRALEAFFTEPVDVAIAVIPGGRDPDDLLKEPGGADAFAQVIESAADALDFRFGRLADRLANSDLGSGSSARAALIESDLRRLVELGLGRLSPIRQSTVCRRYAELAGIDEAAVRKTLATLRSSSAAQRPRRELAPDEIDERADAARQAAQLSPRTPAEHAIACLLARPSLATTSASGGVGEIGTSPEDSAIHADYLVNLSGLLQNAAYSSAAAQRVARRIGRWVNNPSEHRPAPDPSGAASHSGPSAGELSDPGPRDDALMRFIEASAAPEERSEELGLARSFALSAERACEGDADRLAEVWRDSLAEVARRSGRAGASAEAKPAAAGLDEALQAARAAHARGGNPRAMPRPRA